MFAFAGMWESCSILVKPSSAVMQQTPARKPVIVDPAQYNGWLVNAITARPEILSLQAYERPGALINYSVSSWVNSPAQNDSRVVQPINPTN